ncbi:MAG: quinolinate synthase NadA [Candidatus Caenarcaniphilales bacterium]|nr:quinolinate synthase NadA [Candidatus Caenarcaniphilales bacterium]
MAKSVIDKTSEKLELFGSIKELARQKNAVILTHIYQRLEVQRVADFVGDSLMLSKKAAETNADIIIFCGVHFMAETAKLLNPSKKVLLPDIQSGCPMADMINVDDLRAFKQAHPGAPVVCYINSSAAVKAESDICCTSTNAVDITRSLDSKEVIFVPDKGLGEWVQYQVPEKKIHIYDGFCPTHWQITSAEVDRQRINHPDAVIIAHPECDPEVWRRADFVGSTSEIYKFIENSHGRRFIILSEQGLVARIQADFPEKEIMTVFPLPLCPNMKYHSLENLYDALDKEYTEITVPDSIAKSARAMIDRMMEVSNRKETWSGPTTQNS